MKKLPRPIWLLLSHIFSVRFGWKLKVHCQRLMCGLGFDAAGQPEMLFNCRDLVNKWSISFAKPAALDAFAQP